MADSATLDIILKMIVKGQKDLDKLKKSLGKTQAETEKTGAAFAKFGQLLEGIGAGAILTFAMQAGKMFLQFADGGFQIERAERALIAYTGSQWQAAAATKAVLEASDGLLSHYEAVQTASRLFSMGLAKNADDAARLTRIAIELGTAMGRGPQQAFEEFTLLLSNQSIQRLDTFGISAARVRQRIRELQAQTKGLDRQTAFVEATLEIAQQKLEALKKAGYEAGTALDRLSAQWRSDKEAAEQWAASVVENVLTALTAHKRVDDALVEHEKHMRETAQTYDDYITEMLRAEVVAGRLTKAQADQDLQMIRSGQAGEEFYRSLGLLDEEMFKAFKLAGQVSDSFQRMTAEEANAAAESGELEDAVKRMNEGWKKYRLEMGKLSDEIIGRNALAILGQQLRDGKITWDEYYRGAYNAMTTLMGMDSATARARLQLSNLQKQLQDGEIDLETYEARARALVDTLNAIPRDIGVNIRLNVHGRIPTFGSSGGVTTGSGGIYAKQYGGTVLPGLPYIVGERRPEAFVPRERGRIVPDAASAPAAAPINVTVYPQSEVDIVQALEEARILGVLQ